MSTPKIDAKLFSKLTNELEALLEVVTDRVNDFNEKIKAKYEEVNTAVNTYNDKLAEIRELTESAASEANNFMSEKSEKWAEGDRAAAIQGWVDDLEGLNLDDLEVDLPSEVDEPEGPIDDLRAMSTKPE